MAISDIQKRRFLETIFKMYYSLGGQPSDNEVSVLYGRYFSRFRVGNSIPVPYADLSTSSVIDPEKLNRIMVHILFNLDIVYEAYHEHVEKLYEVVTSYSKRLDSLRSRRAELEKTVDDYLFSIKNTDGFYFSITNAFNNTSLTDLNYTTAYVDTQSRKVTIPKISSGLFDYVGNLLNTTNAASVSIIFEGTQVKNDTVDFTNVFNGLTNAQWMYKHTSRSLGVCTLKIVVPISGVVGPISVVEGTVSSQKPVSIGVIVVDPNERNRSATSTKTSSKDYDRFSFSFTPQISNSVEIYLTKDEPDYITRDNEDVVYNYDFRIDELIITAPYYDSSAIFVSRPMSLPSTNNSKLTIDAVSISVEDQLPQGANIRYYIAPDSPSASNVYDYNWNSISPTNAKNPLSPTVINFNGSQRVEATVVQSESGEILSSQNTIFKIPRSTEFNNPIVNYFYASDPQSIDFNLYRFGKFAQDIKPYDSYILESVDSNQLTVHLAPEIPLDKEGWQQVLSGERSDVVYATFSRDVPLSQDFFSAQSIPYGSIYISTNIFSENSLSLTETLLKDLAAQYWDIRIYLNGVDITANSSLSPGVLSSSLTWPIKQGRNDLVIVINKSTNNTSGVQTPFNGTIALFKDRSILSIPGINLFKNYLYEVKVEDLRAYYSNIDNVYSIINYENNYEIVYRRTEEIKEGSKVYYYSNTGNGPQAIRLRADMLKGESYSSSPSLLSYTVKFKH
jgi:hypothetical protein